MIHAHNHLVAVITNPEVQYSRTTLSKLLVGNICHTLRMYCVSTVMYGISSLSVVSPHSRGYKENAVWLRYRPL